jgi:hypothetical protein
MSDSYRHHVATRREIVFIEVPVAGSPKEGRRLRPPRYPHQERQAWRPSTRPPTKAERLNRFLRDLAENDRIAREMMKPDLALLKAWASGMAFAA